MWCAERLRESELSVLVGFFLWFLETKCFVVSILERSQFEASYVHLFSSERCFN